MRPNAFAPAVAIVIALVTVTMPAGAAALRDPLANELTRQEGGDLRWRVEPAVRHGIDDIRLAIDSRIAARGDSGLTRETFGELGVAIDDRVTRLVSCCIKPGPAGRHLHMLLAEMVDGTDLMKRATTVDGRRLGLLKVIQALNLYGTLFIHPDWRALDESIDVSAR
ncbi:hypothetical protein [Aromatoleum diolicum]|uniref:Uncharacterized protein n=1 Tax=Aromatoleum diolicum TaxID=75796 RepID=A0ABX1QCA0_9RHOO|nr:hypothetical protein [Aromatoleum diolicum]NMG75948.1 hypothetical protein [Aromatoleum diolicum]